MGPDTYLPLACYGKLPFWPEYLEQGVSYPSSRALRDWMHQGRMESGVDASEGVVVPDETRWRRFVYGAPKALEVIAGVVRPSRDQGGLRAFPFAAFVHIPRRLFGRHHALMPLCLEPVWEALEDAWDALFGCAEQSAFEEAMQAHRVPAPTPPGEVRSAFDAGLRESPARLVDAREGLGLGQLAEGFASVLRAIKEAPDGAGVAIELPVSREPESRAFDAAFWMNLLSRQFFWRKVDPWLFLDARGPIDAPDALLVVGGLEAGLYPVAMTSEPGEAPVHRPCHAAPGGDASTMDASFAELLRKKLGP